MAAKIALCVVMYIAALTEPGIYERLINEASDNRRDACVYGGGCVDGTCFQCGSCGGLAGMACCSDGDQL